MKQRDMQVFRQNQICSVTLLALCSCANAEIVCRVLSSGRTAKKTRSFCDGPNLRRGRMPASALRFCLIQGHRRTEKRLQCFLVDLVAFTEIDGTA